LKQNPANNTINWRTATFEMLNNPIYSTHLKVFELLKEFFYDKKHKLYKIFQEIFPLTEIICYDETQNNIIKPTEITESNDIKLLNNFDSL